MMDEAVLEKKKKKFLSKNISSSSSNNNNTKAQLFISPNQHEQKKKLQDIFIRLRIFGS